MISENKRRLNIKDLQLVLPPRTTELFDVRTIITKDEWYGIEIERDRTVDNIKSGSYVNWSFLVSLAILDNQKIQPQALGCMRRIKKRYNNLPYYEKMNSAVLIKLVSPFADKKVQIEFSKKDKDALTGSYNREFPWHKITAFQFQAHLAGKPDLFPPLTESDWQNFDTHIKNCLNEGLLFEYTKSASRGRVVRSANQIDHGIDKDILDKLITNLEQLRIENTNDPKHTIDLTHYLAHMKILAAQEIIITHENGLEILNHKKKKGIERTDSSVPQRRKF